MAVERHSEYETVYILRPSAGEDVAQKTRDRVEGIISNGGGHVLRFDNWGSRKLAYQIKDKVEGITMERGTYQYYRYLGAGDLVSEVERNLRILDSVVKFLTVKIDADLIPEDRIKQPTDLSDIDIAASDEEE